ncbi:MAG: hypothetical protein EOO17_03370 [Chloroflexi bacterium]|nr:MAG: hypothetical protein EOO17_03370 [Chloroflexota bacterium]
MEETVIYDITKEYTNMYKVVVYKKPYVPFTKNDDDRDKAKLTKNDNNDESLQRSVRRSRTMINDYVHCNEFDLFITFTFDPKKVNRYDLTACYLKMQGWLWRTHRKYKDSDFRYVIVPEKHKDGAIHFHALIGGYDGPLKKTNVIQNNKRVYNVSSFRFGFTNAQYLDDDKQKAIAYLCKYITKDMVMVSNRRRYWSSRNLQKPISFRNKIYEMGISKFLNHKTATFESDYNVVYEVSKDLFVN